MSTNDPLDSADNATLAPRHYYGQVLIDTYFCALVKGAGKVPFDPAQHKQRFTAIKIDLVPLPEANTTNPISRELIAESKEWVNFTLASLKALGVKTAEIRNKWAKVEFAKTGETYQNKDGETKDKTAMKFVAVYPDETACRTAYEAENGTSPAPTQQPQANGNGHDLDTRAKLMPFIKMIVQKAKFEHPDNDLVKIGQDVSIKIAEHGTLSKYFTATDDDVMELIADGAVYRDLVNMDKLT